MVPMQANYGNFNPAQYQHNPDQSTGQIGDRFAKVAADIPRLWREGERWGEERERFQAERERMQAERNSRSANNELNKFLVNQYNKTRQFLSAQGFKDLPEFEFQPDANYQQTALALGDALNGALERDPRLKEYVERGGGAQQIAEATGSAQTDHVIANLAQEADAEIQQEQAAEGVDRLSPAQEPEVPQKQQLLAQNAQGNMKGFAPQMDGYTPNNPQSRAPTPRAPMEAASGNTDLWADAQKYVNDTISLQDDPHVGNELAVKKIHQDYANSGKAYWDEPFPAYATPMSPPIDQWGDIDDFTDYGASYATPQATSPMAAPTATPTASQPAAPVSDMTTQTLTPQPAQAQATAQPDRFAQYNQELSDIKTDIDTQIAELTDERNRLGKQLNGWQGAAQFGGNKPRERIRGEIKEIDARIDRLQALKVKAIEQQKPKEVDPWADKIKQAQLDEIISRTEKNKRWKSPQGKKGKSENTRVDTTPIITRATNAQNRADAIQQAIITLEKTGVQNPILNANNDPTNGVLAEFYGVNAATLKTMRDDKIGEVHAARGELRDLNTPEAQNYLINGQTLMSVKLERMASDAVAQNEPIQTVISRYNLSDAELSYVTELYRNKQKQKTHDKQIADTRKRRSEVNVAISKVGAKPNDSVETLAKKVMAAQKKHKWTDAFAEDVMKTLTK